MENSMENGRPGRWTGREHCIGVSRVRAERHFAPVPVPGCGWNHQNAGDGGGRREGEQRADTYSTVTAVTVVGFTAGPVRFAA